MSTKKNDWVKIFAFVTLILSAFLILVNNILPLIKISVGGSFFNILTLIKDLALLLGIALAAYAYAKPKGKSWLIVYWVAVIIYVIGAFLIFA